MKTLFPTDGAGVELHFQSTKKKLEIKDIFKVEDDDDHLPQKKKLSLPSELKFILHYTNMARN